MSIRMILCWAIYWMVLPNQAHSQWASVCNTGNGFVDYLETFNGELYATGFFTSLCGKSHHYIAKYDGNEWLAMGKGLPNAGHHLAVIDNSLYGVAYQPKIDSNWLYKYDGTDFVKVGAGTFLSNAVLGFSQTNNLYNIIAYNGQIVVCGEFDRVGKRKISGIMQWNGTQWDSLGTGLKGNIPGTAPVMYPHDLCLYGSDLIVSGNFRSAGDKICNGIARWDGQSWHSMGQGFNSTVYAIGVFNGELYAGGDFTASGNTTLKYIAKWDGAKWTDPGFNLYYADPMAYSFIHTLKTIDDRLYICGGFDRVATGNNIVHCAGIVAFDGTNIDTLQGGLKGNEVEGVVKFKGSLYASGGSSNANAYIAMYNASTATSDLNKGNHQVNIYPNPTNSNVNIQSDDVIESVIVTNAIGQTVYQLSPNDTHVTFDLLDNGLYLIKIMLNHKLVIKKIFVSKN